MKKTMLSTILLSLFVTSGNMALAEDVINKNKAEDLNKEIVSELREVNKEEIQKKVKAEINKEEKTIKTESFILTPEEVNGYYTYNSFKEWREKHDPKKEDNNFFSGGIVNIKDGEMFTEQKQLSQLEQDVDKILEKEKIDKELFHFKIYYDLKPMMGISLFDEIKDIEHTAFLFIDFEFQKPNLEVFFRNLYHTAKENGYNIILFPLSFINDKSEEQAYNWLKVFSITTPTKVLSLPDDKFYETFNTLKFNKEYSQMFMDGVVTNNIIYAKKLGLVNPISLVRVNFDENNEKDKNLLIMQNYADKQQLEEFFKK